MKKDFIIWDDSESFMADEERNTNKSLAEHLSRLGYKAITEHYTYIDFYQINDKLPKYKRFA